MKIINIFWYFPPIRAYFCDINIRKLAIMGWPDQSIRKRKLVLFLLTEKRDLGYRKHSAKDNLNKLHLQCTLLILPLSALVRNPICYNTLHELDWNLVPACAVCSFLPLIPWKIYKKRRESTKGERDNVQVKPDGRSVLCKRQCQRPDNDDVRGQHDNGEREKNSNINSERFLYNKVRLRLSRRVHCFTITITDTVSGLTKG